MANFKNKSDKYEVLTTIVINEDFKKRCPIAYNLKVEEMMEECGMSMDEAEKTLLGSEVEMELYYEKGRGFFAVESDAVECTNIYSPYTKEEFVDVEDLDEVVTMFISQPWYNEWEKAYYKYSPYGDPIAFVKHNVEIERASILIGGAFDWEHSEKGLDYWSENNNEWVKLLNEKNVKIKKEEKDDEE